MKSNTCFFAKIQKLKWFHHPLFDCPLNLIFSKKNSLLDFHTEIVPTFPRRFEPRCKSVKEVFCDKKLPKIAPVSAFIEFPNKCKVVIQFFTERDSIRNSIPFSRKLFLSKCRHFSVEFCRRIWENISRSWSSIPFSTMDKDVIVVFLERTCSSSGKKGRKTSWLLRSSKDASTELCSSKMARFFWKLTSKVYPCTLSVCTAALGCNIAVISCENGSNNGALTPKNWASKGEWFFTSHFKVILVSCGDNRKSVWLSNNAVVTSLSEAHTLGLYVGFGSARFIYNFSSDTHFPRTGVSRLSLGNHLLLITQASNGFSRTRSTLFLSLGFRRFTLIGKVQTRQVHQSLRIFPKLSVHLVSQSFQSYEVSTFAIALLFFGCFSLLLSTWTDNSSMISKDTTQKLEFERQCGKRNVMKPPLPTSAINRYKNVAGEHTQWASRLSDFTWSG